MKNVFVGNLNFRTSESELRSAFEPFGEILNVRLMTDRDTGRSRGFAFVEMSDDQEAEKAITQLNGKELDGRVLNVSEAKPKPQRFGPKTDNRFSREQDNFRFGSRREPRW